MALARRHGRPDGHWNWPIPATHSHAVRCGEMIFVGGQADLDVAGRVRHPGDHSAQGAAVMAHVGLALASVGADATDLVKLVAFYVNDGGVDEAAFLAGLARHLPSGPLLPVITAVPLPTLGLPGLAVEVEAVAMRGADGRRLGREARTLFGAGPFPDGLRCGEMIFAAGQSAVDAAGGALAAGDIVGQSAIVMERLGEVLAAFGADHDDVVKINNYYVGGDDVADWEAAARVRARYFAEPGPAATGMPVPRHAVPGIVARSEVIAMRGRDGRRLPRRHVWPEGHWDWPIHMPYKHGIKCGEMIFVGGQVALTPRGEVIAPGDLPAQTRLATANIAKVLAGFGGGLDDAVKLTSFYDGRAATGAPQTEFAIRSAAFRAPGPAATGVPMPCLAYRGMVVEIEAVAMQERDAG